VRAARAAVLSALIGCAPTAGVWGRLTEAGQPRAGAAVTRGSLVATTDAEGGFSWDTGDEGPVDVWLSEDRVHTDLGCQSPHVIDLESDASAGSARIALLVRGVTAEQPTFVAQYTRAVSQGRSEVVHRGEVHVLAATPMGEGAKAWTLHVDVPPADRWALGLSTLVAAGEGQTVDQVLLLGGDDLRDGDVAAFDLYLSDETLRGWLAWDLSGPPGAAAVDLVETLTLDDLPIDVTTWRGPVRQPRLVPLVQRTAASLPTAIEGRFTYGPAEACQQRSVRMLARFSPAAEPDPAGTLRFAPPWPSPPLVALRGDVLQLSGFPRDAADVVWSSQGWTARGTGACGAVEVAVPVAARGGSLTWTTADVGGECALSPTWAADPP
jgi:hypothetical protein